MKPSLIALATLFTITANSVIAAPPDPATRDVILQRYNLLLKSGRGCSYFANPQTLEKNGRGQGPDDRFVWALNAGMPDDGGICRGVFNFLFLSVNCRSKVVTFKDSAFSLEEQERNKRESVDKDVADKVCAIGAKNTTPPNKKTGKKDVVRCPEKVKCDRDRVKSI
jgi:hypothetical protein